MNEEKFYKLINSLEKSTYKLQKCEKEKCVNYYKAHNKSTREISEFRNKNKNSNNYKENMKGKLTADDIKKADFKVMVSNFDNKIQII